VSETRIEPPATVRGTALSKSRQRGETVFVYQAGTGWAYGNCPPGDARDCWAFSTRNQRGTLIPGAQAAPAARPPVDHSPEFTAAPPVEAESPAEMHPLAQAATRAVRWSVARAVAIGRDSAAGFPVLADQLDRRLEAALVENADLQEQVRRLTPAGGE